MSDKKDAPQGAEQTEGNHHISHAGGIEFVRWREIGTDCERGTVEQHEENGAAKPAHLRAKETNRFFAMLGGQPVSLVGRIDAFARFVGENAGSDEGDEGREPQDHERECKE